MAKRTPINLIKEKWKNLETEPGVFKYNLKVLNRKCLQGKFNFYTELNPDRSTLRRVPQVIPTLNPGFDHNKFNFNKINPKEKLLDIPFEDTLITFIVNQSPLTAYHSLICPDLEKSHPQKITESALDFCVQFLLTIDDRGFRIGYNSPGALASVNHLHLHLMYIDCDLYIDNADLQTVAKGKAYRMDSSMPTEAICFIIDEKNNKSVVKSIYDLIEYLCKENIPHNIFITPDRKKTAKRLKLFVYGRERHCNIKDLTAFNLAFCELSGYIPLGDAGVYEALTEDSVIKKIKEESGNVYNIMYKYLNEL